MVSFQTFELFVQTAGELGTVFPLFGRQFVNILVKRLAVRGSVDDTVRAGIRKAATARYGWPQGGVEVAFDAMSPGLVDVSRDANGSGPVPCAVGEVYGGFVTGDEAFVAVRGRIATL